ncbi:2-hydroxyacid dehydrogenase [Staphylococcus carnosus]|uniref:D-isomer specific 2-hydroxyacid dehydrogenase n=2 Tax=Staphylococcus carnosus TaxID=1281 RepID=B9DIY3_STACT|nr:D-glycerate dehydrogenase [Staphylococcus carnosus]ANZ33849.1 D-glycerate dehydrogenase [Staphylococcus carnosus]KKB24779.1 2-ketogluconate reductase [Staphylococcus carnosus]KOR14090.1 2-ketogluconate reductase [Staphylococcus carnosus]POA02692.1 D-glycerate dehydrogenase [Staphylococcus carnosus]QPT03625.1 D-glycerate dehydrogenase [Staphylococcus carnosus]
MTKVLVTRKIPERFVDQLKAFAEVEMWDEEYVPMPREKFLEELKDADACFITLSEKVNEETLDAAPKLKIIANLAVGYDNIDIPLAEERGVTVTNTPEVLTETTAELGFALMLATARRIVEAEQYIRDGKWKSWGPYLLAGKDVHGSKVGIFGMGDIGKAFARRLKGFEANVMYHNRSRHRIAEKELGVLYVSFDELLENSDFVICTAPLTPETKDKFNRAAFKKMRNDAIFINIGRGATVVEEDLIQALKDGEIAGAGLDVFREEPISTDHPLLKLSNAVVLPHIGSASVVTRDRMIQLSISNVKAVLEGHPPITPVTDNKK